MGKNNRLPFPLEFSRFCLMVETKIIAILGRTVNVCGINIENNFIINHGGQRVVKGDKFSIPHPKW